MNHHIDNIKTDLQKCVYEWNHSKQKYVSDPFSIETFIKSLRYFNTYCKFEYETEMFLEDYNLLELSELLELMNKEFYKLSEEEHNKYRDSVMCICKDVDKFINKHYPEVNRKPPELKIIKL